MKKIIFKILYTITVFIIFLFVIGHFTNAETVDMTAQMGAPTFPVLTFYEGNTELNTLRGYATEMEVNHIRSSVLPVDETRSVSFKMNTYGSAVSNLQFEVRQASGSSLVESSKISDMNRDGDIITGSFQLKDLIDADSEYILVVLADIEEKTVRFYSRVVWTEGKEKYHVQEELDFVRRFIDLTFDKNGASEELSTYLESSSEGDNTSFSHVNIHSSYDHVTWGSLNIQGHTEPEIELTDIHNQTANFGVRYQVTQKTVSGEEKLYNVSESYRVRYTTDRIYLLNFDRTMNYVFNGKKEDITDNVINLWITESDIPLKESDGGNAFAFVSENRLYAYNSTDNKLARVFGFYNEDYYDERTTFPGNTIHILNVDEAGNVEFVVSGYMSRGDHEGYVGMAVYEFNSQLNTIEEQVFVPVTMHQDILRAYNDKMLYANTKGQLYFLLEGDVYMINLATREQKKLIENLTDDRYCISDSGSIIAWQDEDRKSVKMMDLANQAESEMNADGADFVRTLGFMGEDLVYGLVHSSDVHTDQMGSPVYGMHSIRIVDKDGNQLENYNPTGALITGATIENNVIRLSRAAWNEETGLFESMIDDQIMSTIKETPGGNKLQIATTEDYKNILEIICKSSINTKSLRGVTPNMTLYEGSREVTIASDRDSSSEPYYYVYEMNGDVGIYDNPADAVNIAYNAPGVVINDDNQYVWYKGNLLTSNQIMYITNLALEWENMPLENSTAVCLDLILQHRGISVNVQSMLDQGKTTLEILESNLMNTRILELEGCPMEAMLYYVNQDIPVMATLNDGSSLLLIGFNDLNTVLLEPTKGEVYKLGRNDTAALFESNGNHFVTYLPGVSK